MLLPLQVATKRAGNPSVMDFALDEEKFEKRSEEGCDDVYKDPMSVRTPGPGAEDSAQQVGLLSADAHLLWRCCPSPRCGISAL